MSVLEKPNKRIKHHFIRPKKEVLDFTLLATKNKVKLKPFGFRRLINKILQWIKNER